LALIASLLGAGEAEMFTERIQQRGRLILIGRGVGRVDLHRGGGEGAVEIANGAVGRLAAVDRAVIGGGGTSRAQIIRAPDGRIANAHHVGDPR
jgi:hypothetical protein